jgi:hypothetical protein
MLAKLQEAASLHTLICLSEGHHLGKLSRPDDFSTLHPIAPVHTDDEDIFIYIAVAFIW